MRIKDVVGGPWKGPGGPRVLVENPDFGIGYSMERLLIDHGHDVAVCEGPDCSHGRRCPLVATGTCDLATNADVIVHSLNLDRPDHAEVLQALRKRCPDARIVVEVPTPAVARHKELLEGCSILRFPATRTTLTSAVEAAVASRAHGHLPVQRKRRSRPRRLAVEIDVVPTIMVHVVGPVTSAERAYAEQKVANLLRHGPTPVRLASLELRTETDPGWERPALARAAIDLDGHRVCIHADATTMLVAIDELVARLGRRLEPSST